MLNLEFFSRPVWVSAYYGKSSQRAPWKSWICGGFLQWFWSQNAKEKPAVKSASRKQKIRRRTIPAKSSSQAPKSAAKPTNKSACQTSKYTPRLFSIEEACSWRCIDSRTLFGCLLGMVEAPKKNSELYFPCLRWTKTRVPKSATRVETCVSKTLAFRGLLEALGESVSLRCKNACGEQKCVETFENSETREPLACRSAF